MRRFVLFIGFAIILLFPKFLYAQESTKTIVTLPSAETYVGDYYAYGDTVEILGKVDGDVYAFAERVLIDGEVTGDVLVAGQDVTISGNVGQDARVAGVNVSIDGTISRNLSVAAFNFTLAPDGTVNRNAQIVADEAKIEGTIEGDTQKYTSADAPQAPEETVAGIGLFADMTSKVISFVSTLIFGYILIRLFPEYTQRATDIVVNNFGKSLLVGFVGLVVFPIAIIIFLITILGIPFAVLLGCFFVIYLFLTRIYVMMAIGDKITTLAKIKIEKRIWRFTLGILIYYALSVIPVIGGVVKLVVLVAGFGAALMNERKMYSLSRKSKIF